MVTLWTRMEEIYPHRWSSKLGEPGSSAFETWRQGLAGMTPPQIARGLQQCIERHDSWPPSLPEFRGLCRPSPQALELPTPEAAFRMASQQQPDWRQWHPIVFHARQAVGAYDLIHRPEAYTWPRFKTIYGELVEQALQGATFRYPETVFPRLTHTKPVRRTAPQVAKANLARIRMMIGNRAAGTGPGTDAHQSEMADEPNTESSAG